MANFIKEIKDPLTGNPRYVVYETNGGTRYFSTKEEAYTYTPNTTDPSENVLNDAIADVISGKGLIKGGYNLLKGGYNFVKSGIKSIASDITKQGVKEGTKRQAKRALSKGAETVIQVVPRATISTTAGIGTNKLSYVTTGQTLDDHIQKGLSKHWGFDVPYLVSMGFNPSYKLGYKWGDQAMRKAFYNQVTPFSYGNELNEMGIVPTTKMQE